MSPNERRPTLTDCGCEATVYADGSGIELHYCPMHRAAPQLSKALRACVAQYEKRAWTDPASSTCPVHAARAAIKAAE